MIGVDWLVGAAIDRKEGKSQGVKEPKSRAA